MIWLLLLALRVYQQQSHPPPRQSRGLFYYTGEPTVAQANQTSRTIRNRTAFFAFLLHRGSMVSLFFHLAPKTSSFHHRFTHAMQDHPARTFNPPNPRTPQGSRPLQHTPPTPVPSVNCPPLSSHSPPPRRPRCPIRYQAYLHIYRQLCISYVYIITTVPTSKFNRVQLYTTKA
eukprot:1013033-Pyramimonas_sp.AAC.1